MAAGNRQLLKVTPDVLLDLYRIVPEHLYPSDCTCGYVRASAWRVTRNAPVASDDAGSNWRLVYRVDSDAIVILEVFAKKTSATPKTVIATCRKRLKEYDDA